MQIVGELVCTNYLGDSNSENGQFLMQIAEASISVWSRRQSFGKFRGQDFDYLSIIFEGKIDDMDSPISFSRPRSMIRGL